MLLSARKDSIAPGSLCPQIPQKCAGLRMLPPMSDPISSACARDSDPQECDLGPANIFYMFSIVNISWAPRTVAGGSESRGGSSADRPAAMAAAEPPEEPPGLRVRSQGLFVVPCSGGGGGASCHEWILQHAGGTAKQPGRLIAAKCATRASSQWRAWTDGGVDLLSSTPAAAGHRLT